MTGLRCSSLFASHEDKSSHHPFLRIGPKEIWKMINTKTLTPIFGEIVFFKEMKYMSFLYILFVCLFVCSVPENTLVAVIRIHSVKQLKYVLKAFIL